jgi:excisionase family DNA binding protein
MELMTIQEAADALRVAPITVRRYIRSGRLRAVRVGRLLRIEKDDVEALPEPVERDVETMLRDAKPITMDDPLWNIVGLLDGDDDPTDMSANKHKYLDEAYQLNRRKK